MRPSRSLADLCRQWFGLGFWMCLAIGLVGFDVHYLCELIVRLLAEVESQQLHVCRSKFMKLKGCFACFTDLAQGVTACCFAPLRDVYLS